MHINTTQHRAVQKAFQVHPLKWKHQKKNNAAKCNSLQQKDVEERNFTAEYLFFTENIPCPFPEWRCGVSVFDKAEFS